MDRLQKRGEGLGHVLAARGWDGAKDAFEFAAPGCGEIGVGADARSGQAQVDGACVGRRAPSFQPSAALEQSDQAADGALVEAETEGEPVLRDPGLSRDVEE